jgi:hypothetical protein
LSFRHFDASQGLISSYEIDPSSLADLPEPLTAGSIAQWRCFLLAQAPDVATAQRAAFLSESLAEAEKSAQLAAGAERELIDMSGLHMANYIKPRESRQNGPTEKDYVSEYSWSLFQMRSLIRKRQLAIYTLASAVAGAVLVLEKAGPEKPPSAEAVKIEEVLRNELNLRLADYEGVKASLKKAGGEGTSLTDASCVMAMISLVMLADHIDYLRKSLCMIPGSGMLWTGSGILPPPLARNRASVMELFTHPLITLGAALACWDAGTDGARIIAAAVGGMDADTRLAYLKHAYLLMSASWKYQPAMTLARLIVSEVTTSADQKAAEQKLASGGGAHILATGLRLAGEDGMARRLIAAAIEESGDNPLLTVALKENRILDKGLKRLALIKGATTPDIAGARIKYIDTIKLVHPTDGIRIKPNVFCVTGPSHAVIYDQSGQTLYLLDASTGAVSILYGKPVTVTSLAAMPDGRILFSHAPDHSRPAIGCRLKTLDPKTGDVRDFAETLKCPGPEFAVSACYDVDGVLWALDGENGKLWWISADISTSGWREIPSKKYRRLSARGGNTAISSPLDESVFRMGPGGQNGRTLDGEFIAKTWTVEQGPNAVLLVSTSLGLSVYDGSDNFAGQISSLANGEAEYPLTQCNRLSYGAQFAGGNLIVEDALSSALHVLQME